MRMGGFMVFSSCLSHFLFRQSLFHTHKWGCLPTYGDGAITRNGVLTY